MNVTPLRLSVLRFLAVRPNGWNAKRMVEELCPRTPGNSYRPRWTEQGLARQTGSVIGPLVKAGLVRREPFAPMYSMAVYITAAGIALVAEHEAASGRAELEQAIRSGA